MELSNSVVIACHQGHADVAQVIRVVLELFQLGLSFRVHFHLCVRKSDVLELLGGHISDSQYVVLCVGGNNTMDEPMKMVFNVVDEVGGEESPAQVVLTPENVPELVRLPGRTVIALGCGTGREPFAESFLKAGCGAYIGPEGPVDQDSDTMFTIAFFYYLLRGAVDPTVSFTVEEAARKAADLDRESREGTWVFRYYSRR